MHRILAQEFSFDLKPVDPFQFNFCSQTPSPPMKRFWVKLKGNIGELYDCEKSPGRKIGRSKSAHTNIALI